MLSIIINFSLSIKKVYCSTFTSSPLISEVCILSCINSFKNCSLLYSLSIYASFSTNSSRSLSSAFCVISLATITLSNNPFLVNCTITIPAKIIKITIVITNEINVMPLFVFYFFLKRFSFFFCSPFILL